MSPSSRYETSRRSCWEVSWESFLGAFLPGVIGGAGLLYFVLEVTGRVR